MSPPVASPARSGVREHVGTEPIDGLRGFAVLLVVFYHTWLFSWLNPSISVFSRDVEFSNIVRPGYLGVDIFFVISAFCLAYPYVRASASGGAMPALSTFAVRRFVKIVPSYALCLAATMAVALGAGSVPASSWPRVIWQHVLFVQNIDYDLLGHDNSVLWSLAVEVQFYVVFPLMMWLFLKRPALATLAFVVIAQAYRHRFASCCLHDEDVMRLLPAYLDLFAAGIAAAWFVGSAKAADATFRRRGAATVLGIAGIVAVFAFLGKLDADTYVADSREWYSVNLRTLFGIAVAVAAAGSCLGFRWWRAVIGNPALSLLSLISYNVYLWHTLIELFLAHHNIPYAATKEPHDDARWRIPFVVTSLALVTVVSTAITYFFERPILSLVKPHTFSFPYASVVARVRARLGPPRMPARPETDIANVQPIPEGRP